MVVSCSDPAGEPEKPTEPIVIPSEFTNITLPEGATGREVTFMANASWSIGIASKEGTKATVDWLTVSPMSGGVGEATIDITAQENIVTEPRAAIITITDSVKDYIITVSQEGTDTLEGAGTEADPYQISMALHLKVLAAKVNGGENQEGIYYKLNNDIDLAGSADNQWVAIGSYDNQFNGSFDGGGHKISGLYIDNNLNCQGLFGFIEYSGEVKNLGVDGTVSGKEHVGGVAEVNYGTIDNCYNQGDVSGTGIYDSFVGGVAGNNDYGTITNCYNVGDVSGTGNYVGGVVGGNSSFGTITNCYNTGDVSGEELVGGVVGHNDYGTIANCYNSGTVSSTGNGVGGVAGYNCGTITNCYNTGAVSGNSSVGGVVGGNVGGGTVTNCYNVGDVSGNR